MPKLLSKLEHAARACRQGVPRVHLLNGNVNEALLAEVFSHEGVGTMVYSNEYQQIRRVFKKDVRAVMTLIRESVNNEELVRRTRADILAHLEDYWVLEIDRNLVGCVARASLSRGEESGARVSLRRQERGGPGIRPEADVVCGATRRGEGREAALRALSTQAFNYFQQKGGFVEVDARRAPAGAPARIRRERAQFEGHCENRSSIQPVAA